MGYIKSFDEKLNNKKVIEQNMLGLKMDSVKVNMNATQ